MLTFRKADRRDAPAIAALVNAANSGGDTDAAGWTHEAELFEGDRIDAAEIAAMIAAPNAMFLLCRALGQTGGELAGCVYLKTLGDVGYMGLFAVLPALQSNGVGKRLIVEGERIVRDEWRCTAMHITVFTRHRPELAAYYQRRGYERTGRFKLPERAQAPKAGMAEELLLEWMEKRFAPA